MVLAVQVPEEIERLYVELATCIQAKDDKGVKRVFRELLDIGRSRQEIVSEVVLLLDKKPGTGENPSNRTAPIWSATPQESVGRNPGEHDRKLAAWPDIAPQFSNGSVVQPPSGIAAEQGLNRWTQDRPDGKNQRSSGKSHKPKRISGSSATLPVEPEARKNAVPEGTQTTQSASTPSSGKDTAYYTLAAPGEVGVIGDQADNVGEKHEGVATAVSEIASDTLNALDSFFGSTSPQPVSVNFESVGPSVPERLAAKLRLQSSGTTSGSAQTVGEAISAQTDDSSANWSRFPKRGWRRSAAAIPMLTGMSILAGIVGVVHGLGLWGSYGSELEQAAIASARSAEVWLLKTSNNAVLPDPEYSTAPRKIGSPENGAQAVVVVAPWGSATAAADAPPVPIATFTSESNPPPERNVEAMPAPTPGKDIAASSAPLAAELSAADARAIKSEPKAKEKFESAEPREQNPGAEGIPPRKPIPPDTQASEAFNAAHPKNTESTKQVSLAPPLSAAPQAVASIDPSSLVSRGDQLFGIRDLVSARLFYERAAAAGDGQGALRMGMTFDPAFLGRFGLTIRGDSAQAMSWYRRASALGNTEADSLLNGLKETEK